MGAQRREKTRNRFIESALAVFAEKGPDAPTIDDFISAAGVARGTFYNYFRTPAELLSAVAGEISDEVLSVLDPCVQVEEDPAWRVSTGSRLYMRMACRYPMWGAFITRVGTRRGSRGRLLDELVMRDMEKGMSLGRFDVGNAGVGRDLALGAILYGIETMLSPGAPDDYAEQAMMALLRGLGIGQAESRRIAYSPLPATASPQGAIFERIAASPPRF